jgi:Kef-type K+ transport system membrane component KefB
MMVSVTGKLAGTHLAGRTLGWNKAEAALIGWLWQSRALIMIIFANILLDKHVVTPQALYSALADGGGQHDADDADGRSDAQAPRRAAC